MEDINLSTAETLSAVYNRQIQELNARLSETNDKIDRLFAELNGKMDLHSEKISTNSEVVNEIKRDVKELHFETRAQYATKEELAALKGMLANLASKSDVEGVKDTITPYKQGWGKVVTYVFTALGGALFYVAINYLAAHASK